MPERSKIQRHVPGHTNEDNPSTGAAHRQCLGDGVRSSDTVEDHIRSSGETSGQDQRLGLPANGSGQLSGNYGDVCAEPEGSLKLMLVLGTDHDRATHSGPDQMMKGGDGGKAERSGPDYSDDIPGSDLSGQSSMNSTGNRLDHDGVLVAERFWDTVDLAAVGDKVSRRPTSAGVGTESGLQPGRKVTECGIPAETGMSSTALRAGRLDSSGRTPENRFDHGAGARFKRATGMVDTSFVQHADDLMAGDEGKADQILEVARTPAVDRGQIRTTDPGQQRAEIVPVRPGQVRPIRVEELEWTNGGPSTRAKERRGPRGGVAREIAFEDE
jgi:hypothetical protein